MAQIASCPCSAGGSSLVSKHCCRERSLPHLEQLVGEMTAHRAALVIPAQGIDTSTSNPASQFQLNILMAVADFEREIFRERVNSGLRAAKARGVRFGRSSTLARHLPHVRALLATGLGVSPIARCLTILPLACIRSSAWRSDLTKCWVARFFILRPNHRLAYRAGHRGL